MNLFELFVKIGVDDQASSKISTISQSLGNGLKKAAQIGTAAVSAAAAGITALTSAAVKNYAQYEQLVGGVDTLFKNSSQKVQEYADNAFRTSGLSANAYMETVTSFSASLLQSLAGDTEAAADKADMAIRDMSDNANKMGSSIETLQTAYAGFAKGQFMLLDNLKLGYGGTQEEMKRLLEDAEAISGIEYDISSYADIVDAIHVIQTEMGITGTTAKEAESTISGSTASMKAAWQNLVTGVAAGNQNLDTLISQFTDSVFTAAGNILPRIETAFEGIGELIEGFGPIIEEAVPVVVDDVIPALLDAGAELVGSLADGVLDNADLVIDGATDILNNFVQQILSGFPEIADKGFEIVASLADGIGQFSSEIIPAATTMIEELVYSLTDPDNLDLLFGAAGDLVANIGGAIVESVPRLAGAAVDLLSGFFDYLTSENGLNEILSGAAEIASKLINGLIDSIPDLVGNIGEFAGQIADYILSFEWVEVGLEIAGKIVEGLFSAVGDFLLDLYGNIFGEDQRYYLENVTIPYLLHGENSDYKAAEEEYLKMYYPETWEQTYGVFSATGSVGSSATPRFTTQDFINWDRTATDYEGPSGWGATTYVNVNQYNTYDTSVQSPSQIARRNAQALEGALR